MEENKAKALTPEESKKILFSSKLISFPDNGGDVFTTMEVMRYISRVEDLTAEKDRQLTDALKEVERLKEEVKSLSNRYNDVLNTKSEGALLGHATMEEAYSTISELKQARIAISDRENSLRHDLFHLKAEYETEKQKSEGLVEALKKIVDYFALNMEQAAIGRLNIAKEALTAYEGKNTEG